MSRNDYTLLFNTKEANVIVTLGGQNRGKIVQFVLFFHSLKSVLPSHQYQVDTPHPLESLKTQLSTLIFLDEISYSSVIYTPIYFENVSNRATIGLAILSCFSPHFWQFQCFMQVLAGVMYCRKHSVMRSLNADWRKCSEKFISPSGKMPRECGTAGSILAVRVNFSPVFDYSKKFPSFITPFYVWISWNLRDTTFLRHLFPKQRQLIRVLLSWKEISAYETPRMKFYLKFHRWNFRMTLFRNTWRDNLRWLVFSHLRECFLDSIVTPASQTFRRRCALGNFVAVQDPSTQEMGAPKNFYSTKNPSKVIKFLLNRSSKEHSIG